MPPPAGLHSPHAPVWKLSLTTALPSEARSFSAQTSVLTSPASGPPGAAGWGALCQQRGRVHVALGLGGLGVIAASQLVPWGDVQGFFRVTRHRVWKASTCRPVGHREGDGVMLLPRWVGSAEGAPPPRSDRPPAPARRPGGGRGVGVGAGGAFVRPRNKTLFYHAGSSLLSSASLRERGGGGEKSKEPIGR